MTGVILFRAQPFHNGHLSMVQKAFEDCRKNDAELYLFVGSADKAGTVRNPLPIELRLTLIEGSLHEIYTLEQMKHIHIVPLDDLSDETDNSYHWGRYLFMKMLRETKDSDMTIYYADNPQIMLGWFDNEDRWCLRFKFLDRYEDISATLVRTLIDFNYEVARKFVPNFVYMHIHTIANLINEANKMEALDTLEV